MNARVVGHEIVIDLQSEVLFGFAESNIRPDAAEALGKVSEVISAQKRGGPVRVEGHTDSIGEHAYNQKLSERRAESVKRWLAEHGVLESRISARGLGESKPVAPNTKPNGTDNPTGRQKNRRVQIFVTQG